MSYQEITRLNQASSIYYVQIELSRLRTQPEQKVLALSNLMNKFVVASDVLFRVKTLQYDLLQDCYAVHTS